MRAQALGIMLMAMGGMTLMTATTGKAEEIDARAQARIGEALAVLQSWAAEPALVAAVKRANAGPSDAAKSMDQKKWESLPLGDPFVQALATNEASLLLKSKMDGFVIALTLSAADGTKAAFSAKPDAWSHQSKSKHKLPMAGKTWQGTIEVTESTLATPSMPVIQIAVPVKEGEKAIGSLVADLNLTTVLRFTPAKPVVMAADVVVAADVVIAEEVVAAFIKRMDELLASATHPLFRRHLQSLKAMVYGEWARASVYETSHTTETIGYIQSLLKGFEGAAARWASYTNGLPLFMAYVSTRDGTLQWYAMTLPKGWDPGKTREEQAAYPLFFELHGRGNPHALNYPAGQLGAGDHLVSYAMIQRNGYHVYPFGRGNSGYRDIGETDVWEAYENAQKTVKIDPDRRYLYGFSMGGGGAWELGSRTPDRWAAIAIMGAGTQAGAWGQAVNVSALPIYMWGGEDDTLGFARDTPVKDQLAAFAKAVEKEGGRVTTRSTWGIGHNYRMKEQQEAIDWLQQHVRKRPDRFGFVADTDKQRGIWGITLARDLRQSALPRFSCLVEGRVVRITTEGTSHINVALDKNGLMMTGEVSVVVNGQERFKGNVTPEPLRFDLAK